MIGCSISESADHLSNSVEFIFVINRPSISFVILKLDRLWIFGNWCLLLVVFFA